MVVCRSNFPALQRGRFSLHLDSPELRPVLAIFASSHRFAGGSRYRRFAKALCHLKADELLLVGFKHAVGIKALRSIFALPNRGFGGSPAILTPHPGKCLG